MKRFASNFAILLVLTVAITAVLAMLADAPQQATDDGADSAAAAEPSSTLAEPAADDAAAGASTDPSEPITDEPGKPAHLETDENAATAPADAPETAVAGAVAQASDRLAETGPIELLQWMIIGAGIAATGGMVRGAARDWAKDELTLL